MAWGAGLQGVELVVEVSWRPTRREASVAQRSVRCDAQTYLRLSLPLPQPNTVQLAPAEKCQTAERSQKIENHPSALKVEVQNEGERSRATLFTQRVDL